MQHFLGIACCRSPAQAPSLAVLVPGAPREHSKYVVSPEGLKVFVGGYGDTTYPQYFTLYLVYLARRIRRPSFSPSRSHYGTPRAQRVDGRRRHAVKRAEDASEKRQCVSMGHLAPVDKYFLPKARFIRFMTGVKGASRESPCLPRTFADVTHGHSSLADPGALSMRPHRPWVALY